MSVKEVSIIFEINHLLNSCWIIGERHKILILLNRLMATKIMEQLNSVYTDEDDPYEKVNLITLINPNKEIRLTESLTVETILKRRIKELKVQKL